MTEHDLFERRLADALLLYAAEAPTEVEAMAVARSISAGHPRSSRVAAALGLRRWSPALVWIALAALLLAASIAVAIVGSTLRKEVVPIDQGLGIPPQLYGTWQDGIYTMDFGSDPLISDWNGTQRDDLGRVVEIVPDLARPVVFIVRLEAGCGAGLYRVEATVSSFGTGLRIDQLQDACADRGWVLANRNWALATVIGPSLGPFSPGGTYTSGTFTEPFRFVMPSVDDEGPNQGLAAQFISARRYMSDGGLSFGGRWWSMYILDDLPIHADVCDPTSALLADIPATPGAVGDWLRSSPGLSVSDPVEVPVDGRTALRFDLGDGASSCLGARLPAGGNFGYLMRAYAIPTGDDTILLVVGSDDVNYEAVKAAVEALVRSMDFE